MISTILTAIVIGAIIGGLARLVMPGHQNISIVMTIILGILGSALGSWLVAQFGYSNSSGIAWIAVLAGVVVAAILIAIYLKVTSGRSRV
ncbi:MAG: GlsB/YeaQ/YmgE family stress response membrane protein [Micrococcales bacterium]|nr:GlsB/YeaQ/YmgE family stress response membrane protein [Micrococcales bacterium]